MWFEIFLKCYTLEYKTSCQSTTFGLPFVYWRDGTYTSFKLDTYVFILIYWRITYLSSKLFEISPINIELNESLNLSTEYHRVIEKYIRSKNYILEEIIPCVSFLGGINLLALILANIVCICGLVF
jgi:hypothetical protein